MDVFLIEDGDLLEKYNTIWDKLNADFKKDFDSDPAYNKQFLKIKIKRHGDEDFYNTDIHKVDSNHTCLAVISLDSGLKKDGNCSPQVVLKECKYIEKKLIKCINNSLSDCLFSDESNEE